MPYTNIFRVRSAVEDLREGLGNDTYIGDLHLFLVVDCVDSKGTLVDEVVQTRVRLYKDLLYEGRWEGETIQG